MRISLAALALLCVSRDSAQETWCEIVGRVLPFLLPLIYTVAIEHQLSEHFVESAINIVNDNQAAQPGRSAAVAVAELESVLEQGKPSLSEYGYLKLRAAIRTLGCQPLFYTFCARTCNLLNVLDVLLATPGQVCYLLFKASQSSNPTIRSILHRVGRRVVTTNS